MIVIFYMYYFVLLNKGIKYEVETFNLLKQYYQVETHRAPNTIKDLLSLEKTLGVNVYTKARKGAKRCVLIAILMFIASCGLGFYIGQNHSSTVTFETATNAVRVVYISFLVLLFGAYIMVLIGIFLCARAEQVAKKESWQLVLKKLNIKTRNSAFEKKDWKKNLPNYVLSSIE